MKKNKYFRLFIALNFILTIGASNNIFSQLSSSTVKDIFGLSYNPILSEKVYLHTDREEYIAGESIWFEQYYFLNNQRTLNLSKVLYLELVDASGISVSKAKYKILDGNSNGTLQIPTTILSGYYTLFAYTKWMKNMGNQFYFSKKLFIINPDKAIFTNKPDTLNTNKLSLLFFPEGGRLVAGFQNIINFTAKNLNDINVLTNGRIVDKENNVVAEFKSSHESINQFSFVPVKNQQYRALISGKDNVVQIFNLPKVSDSGLAINCDFDPKDFVKIQFTSNENTPLENKKLSIEIESNGYKYKSIESSILNNPYTEVILKKDLITGLNRITIKNQSGQVLYSNQFAIQFNIDSKLLLKTDKQKYTLREKVSLTIKADNIGKSVSINQFSVSVAKVNDSFSDNTDYSIQNKYGINELYKNNLGVNKDSSNITSPKIFLPETRGLIFTGSIISKSSNKPISNEKVYISTLGQNSIVQNTISNSEGKFLFKLDELFGKSEAVIQLVNSDNPDAKIIMDEEFSSNYKQIQNKAISNFEVNKEYYQKLLTNYQIQKQYNSIETIDSLKQSQSPRFYGVPDLVYPFKKFIDLPSLEDFFNEIVESVKVRKKKENYEIEITSPITKSVLNLSPLLIIDGIPVFNNSTFLKISPADIDKVEIINNNYILGNVMYGGIISLYSKKKNLASIAKSSSFTFFHLDGYTPPVNFIEKKYDSKQESESRIPDFRNTLYWNPNVITNENGEAVISFYTSDENGKFLVDVEGFGLNGEPFNSTMIIEVEK